MVSESGEMEKLSPDVADCGSRVELHPVDDYARGSPAAAAAWRALRAFRSEATISAKLESGIARSHEPITVIFEMYRCKGTWDDVVL